MGARVLCLVALLAGLCAAASYRAAVLQHTHIAVGATPLQVKLNNLDAYAEQMVAAKAQGAHLLVTPEVGLGHDERSRAHNAAFGEHITNTVPSNPCEEASPLSPATNAASCLAAKVGMALVVGTVDLQPCNRTLDAQCPSDGRYIFNTGLAFDAQGTLVAKYHKYHLFTLCPTCFNHPAKPQHSVFDLGLGVPFAFLICFDSLFDQPALGDLALNATHFIFPTSWENVPQVLLSVAWQQAWSRVFGTTLLAANNGAGRAKSGSGIWTRGVALATYFNVTSTDDHLLVATVDDSAASAAAMTAHAVVASARTHHERAVAPVCGAFHCGIIAATPGASGTVSLKRDNISCTLTYRVAADSPATMEFFSFSIHSGLLWFGEFLENELCGLMHCEPGPVCQYPNPLSSGIYATSTLFSELRIDASFVGPRARVFPLFAQAGGAVAPPEAVVLASANAATSWTMRMVNDSARSVLSFTAYVPSWSNAA